MIRKTELENARRLRFEAPRAEGEATAAGINNREETERGELDGGIRARSGDRQTGNGPGPGSEAGRGDKGCSRASR